MSARASRVEVEVEVEIAGLVAVLVEQSVEGLEQSGMGRHLEKRQVGANPRYE